MFKKFSARELKALFVLSIAIPVSILTVFEFTGILGEPPGLQTVTVESTSWSMDRPRDRIEFGETIEKTYVDDFVSLDAELFIICYAENSGGGYFSGGDGLEFECSLKAVLKQDLDASFSIVLLPDADSSATVSNDPSVMVQDNVTVTRMRVAPGVEGALVEAYVTDSPSTFRMMAHHKFTDTNTMDHALSVTFEFTYRNASIYKKAVIPLQLVVLRDVGNTFEAAKKVTIGEYRGCIDNVDFIDMYMFNYTADFVINIEMTPTNDSNYDMFLYDSSPNHDLLYSSENFGNIAESIRIEKGGVLDFYLEIRQTEFPNHANEGPYTLRIEVGS